MGIKIKNWDDKEKFDPQSLYEWRLNWLANTIKKRQDRGEDITQKMIDDWYVNEEKQYENGKNNLNMIEKIEKPIGILVPTHYHHSRFIGACLDACQKTGYYTLLCYDAQLHNPSHSLDHRFPSQYTMLKADAVVMKHRTYGGGVGVPHVWNQIYGLTLLQGFGFEYIFNINGDCVMEKPENFPKLIELLGDNDIIACEYFPERRYCGTMSYLAKTDMLVKIWKHYLSELYKFNIGNAEARMGKSLIDMGAKVVPVENPEDAHFKEGTKGTFRKVIGLRHCHAEDKHRRKMKYDALEEKFYDKARLQKWELETLGKYWETGDKKYLQAWWDKS